MIETKNLCKSFEGREVLKDISTVFEDGKTNLIIGQSGSGKTVLMSFSTSLSSKLLYKCLTSIMIVVVLRRRHYKG